uniref:Uncharacterized protein n=1 Tax=Caldisericum exile TaxID=693075 RepID=A0A7C4TX39_9BACT
MDFKAIHERFKDDDSPSVEGQIRWLQKQGFAQHQIEQAMIATYSAIERGEFTPQNGFELDQYLLNEAKKIRTEELTLMIKRMEDFVANIKKQAIDEYKAQQAKPWYKRLFGKK